MAFKEGVLDADVNSFRAIVAKARDLDVDIDSGLITPQEAAAALEDFTIKNPVAKAKSHKAETHGTHDTHKK
jgi:hypothetical protein